MKTGMLRALFGLYRRVLSPVLHSFGVSRCIFLPTCSEYAYVAIERFGWVKGTGMALARLARCHPLSAGGLDPVPEAGAKR
jgi:putative membrane protein insertion efficiency factor